MKSPWEIVDELAMVSQAGAVMAEQSGDQAMRHIYASLAALSTVVRDHIERVGLRDEGATPTGERLDEGEEYILTLRVRARVLNSSDAHGLCYELGIEQRDYHEGRVVNVDADEIIRAEPATLEPTRRRK